MRDIHPAFAHPASSRKNFLSRALVIISEDRNHLSIIFPVCCPHTFSVTICHKSKFWSAQAPPFLYIRSSLKIGTEMGLHCCSEAASLEFCGKARWLSMWWCVCVCVCKWHGWWVYPGKREWTCNTPTISSEMNRVTNPWHPSWGGGSAINHHAWRIRRGVHEMERGGRGRVT